MLNQVWAPKRAPGDFPGKAKIAILQCKITHSGLSGGKKGAHFGGHFGGQKWGSFGGSKMKPF